MGLFGRKKTVAEEVLVADEVIGVTNTGEKITIDVQNGECDCSKKDLISLKISNPETITKLNCSNNQLTSLPTGMVRLAELDCDNNQITSLPDGMVNLESLFCYSNKLTSLPEGMINLTSLGCGNNQLTSLPEGMVNLRKLDCSDNQLKTLPDGLVLWRLISSGNPDFVIPEKLKYLEK